MTILDDQHSEPDEKLPGIDRRDGDLAGRDLPSRWPSIVSPVARVDEEVLPIRFWLWVRLRPSSSPWSNSLKEAKRQFLARI